VAGVEGKAAEEALATLAFSTVAVDAVPEQSTDIDRSLVALAVKRAQNALADALDESLVGLGVTMKRLAIFREIKAHPGATSAQLAELVFLTPQAFGQHVNRLVEEGLVDRTRGPGRRWVLELTDEGERLFAEAYPLVWSVCESAFQDVPDQDLSWLVEMLLKVEARCFEASAAAKHTMLRRRLV
jgi:DNA-binding MarR family transcriptional regulator